jgi:hypothetical protein
MPHPARELRQNRFLFWRFDRMQSNLSNVHNRLAAVMLFVIQ